MSKQASKPQKRSPKTPTLPEQPDVIDPVWLIKAFSATLVLAACCAYATLCFLYSHGQWQLVLSPSRTSTSPQSIAGIPYELIRFGPDETATPQLVGWWIPAPSSGRYAQDTLLFLPGSKGSLVDYISTLATLHSLGINVFAFDYRGYGQSAPTHPSQQNMRQDTEAALTYLNTSRHIPNRQIIPYGTGVGTSLATSLATAHPNIPALILDSPHADLLDVALHDPRSNLVPARLLFHERFPLSEPLSTLRTPKMLLSYTSSPLESSQAFRTASNPKITVELPSPVESLYLQSIRRFFDQYLPPQPMPTSLPSTPNTP